MSKRYAQAQTLVDEEKAYSLEEAINILKQMPRAKFNESVDISASLNIDPKKAEQLVRGTVILPHGTGKTRSVLVFCKGEKEVEAKEAGADYAGAADLIKKVKDGWLDFDVAIATPDMMRDVSRLGKVLGPRGMMPSPKVGTVTDDVKKAIDEVKRGKVEFKMDKLANIHLIIGKLSFETAQLIENAKVILKAFMRAKPSSVRGRYVKRLTISSTMSPAMLLDDSELENGEDYSE